MAKATAAQLATWSAQAGFTGQDQATAIAVALAAGGNPDAPQGAFGLGGGGGGQAQAQAAFAQWKAQQWAAFPTHQTGSWAFYLPVALGSVVAAPAGGGNPFDPQTQAELKSGLSNLAGQAKDAVNVVPERVGQIAGFLTNPRTWMRYVKIVTGLVLVGLAAASLTKSTIIDPIIGGANQAGERVAEAAVLAKATR